MKECSSEIIDLIIDVLSDSPESQTDMETRKDITGASGTYADKYDLLVRISKRDMGRISSFVRELCALDKHYLRPTTNI